MINKQLSEQKETNVTRSICWSLRCQPAHRGWFQAPGGMDTDLGRDACSWPRWPGAARPGALLRPGVTNPLASPPCLQQRLTHIGGSVCTHGTALQGSQRLVFWKLWEFCCLCVPPTMQGSCTSFLGRMFTFPASLFLVDGHWPHSVLT